MSARLSFEELAWADAAGPFLEPDEPTMATLSVSEPPLRVLGTLLADREREASVSRVSPENSEAVLPSVDATTARRAHEVQNLGGSPRSRSPIRETRPPMDVDVEDRELVLAADLEAEERRTWEFDDLNKGLGVAHDVLRIARPATELGFNIAATATKFGFGIANTILRGTRRASETVNLQPVATVVQGVEYTVGFAQTVTEGCQTFAKGVTLGSMDATSYGLDAAGAEQGALARLALGDDEAAACFAVSAAARRLSRDAGLQEAELSSAELIVGFRRYASEQVDPDQALYLDYVEDVKQFAPWMWLCAATYGAVFNLGLRLFSGCPKEGFLASAVAQHGCSVLMDRTVAPVRKEVFQPAFAVLVDDARKTIVIAIRGTGHIKDVLTDLVCQPTALAAGELHVGAVDAASVHDGMWRAAQRLAAELELPIAAALTERPRYSLLLTGHSLGAGVATLLCLLWRPRLGARVSCIAFAPPATLDLVAARAASLQGVTAVILGNDMVPRLSLRSATDLLAATTQHPVLTERVPALRPGGQLLHLTLSGPEGSEALQARVADPDVFHEMRVCNTMLKSHLPRPYLKALGEDV